MRLTILLFFVFISFNSISQECTLYLISGDTVNAVIRAHNSEKIYTKNNTFSWNSIKAVKLNKDTELKFKPASTLVFTKENHDAILIELNRKMEWKVDQEESFFEVEMSLGRIPDRLEFTMFNYRKVIADINSKDGIVRVGNIRWTPSAQNGHAIATIENEIFRKNGKVRPAWETEKKKDFTDAIIKALKYYE